MQGSYILLASFGVFILIGGAKRILRSFRISAAAAVIIIIAVILGNIFTPLNVLNARLYYGTLILGALCLLYLFSGNARTVLENLSALAVITVLLVIYRILIIDRFNVDELFSEIMLIAGCGISSFILTRSSGQAFSVAVTSIILHNIAYFIIKGRQILIGDSEMLDLVVYSAFAAVLINEIVFEFVNMLNDRAMSLEFEAAEIDENADNEPKEHK